MWLMIIFFLGQQSLLYGPRIKRFRNLRVAILVDVYCVPMHIIYNINIYIRIDKHF